VVLTSLGLERLQRATAQHAAQQNNGIPYSAE